MRLLGVTNGDPFSAGTYSGVPYHLFGELERRGVLVGRINADQHRWHDAFRGFVDLRRTWTARRARRNAYWRYLEPNMARLSKRLAPVWAAVPEYDAVLQFGVGALPPSTKILIAHAEISIQTAATSTIFSKTYGFDELRDRHLAAAIQGERHFLEQCDLIWTNTDWSAQTFADAGVPQDRFWVHPPACNLPDPGEIQRDWSRAPHILFVGKVWNDKGGPLLVNAFRALRRRFPESQLTVVGCNPPVDEPGVAVLGFLDKDNPEHSARLQRAYRDATVFCMPSRWESVGLVYMEAALFGLPVVMLKGQGREDVFPSQMAVHLGSEDTEELSQTLLTFATDRCRAAVMGRFGRDFVLRNFTWPIVADRLLDRISELSKQEPRKNT